jgi:hypothetical protein
MGGPIGIITAGSATYAIKSRDEFFGITKENRDRLIQRNVNNTVFRMEVHECGLMQRVLSIWRRQVPYIWFDLYADDVIGYKTPVEVEEIRPGDGILPGEQRDGHSYKGDNWTHVGETKGSAKPHSGIQAKHTREASREICDASRLFALPNSKNTPATRRTTLKLPHKANPRNTITALSIK